MAQATATNTTAESVRVNRDAKGAASHALRAAAVLTTSYVASSHMPVGGAATVGFIVTCASVDYTSIEIIVQGSYDATTFFDIPSSYHPTAVAAHSQTLANLSAADTVNYLVEAPVSSGRILYVRVLAKRTGGTAVGTVAITGHTGAAQ